MIQSVWVENQNGSRLDIDLRDSAQQLGMIVFNLEGLGSPVATVNGVGGPYFDGVRVNSVGADARSLTLTLAVPGTGDFEEDAKALIYQHFPLKQEITFGVITDRHSVQTKAIVEQNEFSQFAKVENAVISLYCADPYWMDVIGWEYAVDSESGIPLFEFPFSNESLTTPLLEFGIDTALPMAQIIYTGGVKTGCTISMEFNGLVEDVVITNSHGNQEMTIDLSGAETYFGAPVESGDRVVINTRVGQKSVYFIRDGEWYNILNGVGLTDDWIEIRPGTNLVVIKATTGQDLIETDIRFNPLREGV